MGILWAHTGAIGCIVLNSAVLMQTRGGQAELLAESGMSAPADSVHQQYCDHSTLRGWGVGEPSHQYAWNYHQFYSCGVRSAILVCIVEQLLFVSLVVCSDVSRVVSQLGFCSPIVREVSLCFNAVKKSDIPNWFC